MRPHVDDVIYLAWSSPRGIVATWRARSPASKPDRSHSPQAWRLPASRLLGGLILLLASAFPSVGKGAGDVVESTLGRECVVLLHGLARTPHSLDKLENALREGGFIPVNLGYPSRKKPIEALAVEAIPPALARCADADAHTIHFITHSLGGLLVRYYLSVRRIPELGRVVMLSPPNRGSEAADILHQTDFYRWLNGPAGQQLVTGPQGLAARLGPVTYPVGIITGNRHAFFDAWLARRIPGENDGKVAVERAKVDGMTEFLVLPYSHPFIMNAHEVIAQSIHFLSHGRFRPRAVDPHEPQSGLDPQHIANR